MADQQDNPTPTENPVNEVAENASVEEVSTNDVEGTTEEITNVAAASKSEVKFRVGDKVVVNYKIVEGTKSRVQPYEGIVIGIKGGGISKTFTVRRMAAANVGVERIFPMSSPNIESVSVKAKGKVRRAKLYYLRERTGKAASKIKER